MKKLMSTKMKLFMVFLLITSITCFISSMIILYNSDFKLTNYVDFNMWNNKNHTYYSDYSTIILDQPLNDIKNLNIDFTGHDVTLEVHSGNNLIINANKPTSSIESLLNITNNDGSITILPSGISKNILVKIPLNYANNLDFKSTNGYVNLADITLESLKINCINSDVNINNLTLTSGNIYTTDGDISLTDINSKDLSVNTLDGDIYGNNLKGIVNLKTVSGDILAGFTNEITNSKIDTTDGDVSLNIPDNSNFLIDFNTVTGELDDYVYSSITSNANIEKFNNNSKIIIGTGVVPISVTTVDGDLSF